jgi:hypothetical protein
MENVSQLLRKIPKIKMSTGKRELGIGEYMKLTFTPVYQRSFSVKDVGSVDYVSLVTSDLFWVSDYYDLVLTDTEGITIHRVIGITPGYSGMHTVNSSGELIYIDRVLNIKKLSTDNGTVTHLLRCTERWRPHCVHSSPSTGDLIVGMYKIDTYTKGKVVRYSSTGHHILTIHQDKGQTLYSYPRYITENRNGDIIVSDVNLNALVVTTCGGRHRFSYTGPSSGEELWPRGICTDALSHILVCDGNSNTVQIIDKDGHFLSLLLTQQHGIDRPGSLDYDDRTHLLWVGSDDANVVSLYRYIQRRYSLIGMYQFYCKQV